MGSFEARLRVIGQSGFPLPVVVDLTDEQLTVTTDSGRIADWTIAEIDISARGDGFLIEAEGEEVLLNVTDSNRFAVELGRDRLPQQGSIAGLSRRPQRA